MQDIIRAFTEDSEFQSVAAGIRAGMKEQLLAGLSGSSRQVMLAALHEELDRPLFIVTHNLFSAQKMVDDLVECMPAEQVMLFPAQELIVAESAVASPELLARRIDALAKLSSGFRGVVVAPYAGIQRILPSKEAVAAARLQVQKGQTIELDSFIHRLIELGYERVDRVENKGELSVRGGIIDLFPIVSANPYRIELFDDEIESIRVFDPLDQRSTDRLDTLNILPCREIVAERKRLQSAAQHAYELLQAQLAKMNDHAAKDKLLEGIGQELEQLREGVYFQGVFKYVSLIYPERQTLLDYIPEDSVLIVDEPARLIETAKQMEKDEAEWMTSSLAEGNGLPAFVISKSYESLLQRKEHPILYVSLFLRQVPNTQPQNIVNFMSRSMQSFHGQMNVLKSEMDRWKKSGSQVVILAAGAERAERVRRVLGDYQIEPPQIVSGNLQTGFELPGIRLVVITEGEMFTQKQRKARKADRKIENAERIKSYQELKVGDYVVHVNHGIGKYVGIGTLEVGGIHKDYLHIMYAGGDKLSVPVEQIDLIQKYVGAEEGKEPKVYKLGGSDWNRVKTKARSSIQDIADDLIKLYAEREAAPGYAFGPDTVYQQEFEGMFPYEETPDQLRAIDEIKQDMERSRPMDRLLCGDVGYGKTEVAIRAAFKAAIDGKQVAVLVPTTILAQQHFETFSERFSGYPFNIRVLNRFRSRKEQNETTKGINNGTVDIVIGTHRLLSKDLTFKNLGLLIIDEEQRFGVTHKEKLKKLKTNVDVLTLTATPIPRTLHMSMLGVRDLSVIETPPENRFPVQTYVLEHSPGLVREAIERELAREGQVYYLFNRVQGIYQIAEQLSMLAPDAKVTVAHGQMAEQELEKAILDFLDGEYDVLVSTSIIEIGVDIPNVNTLIVHDADKMGLSQMYQLRGRVGRSNRIAYAYFTYQRDKVLGEEAEKRLAAIKEFTELGSGFKIAMRDLSIRGAGNLLGAEQSGFIASVGFDLYSQMLTEEIEKRKKQLGGEAAREEPEDWRVQLDIAFDAYIPSEYIYDSVQKIEIYKKAAAVKSIEEADELKDELKDRFGELPSAVENLLQAARLKVYSALYRIEAITLKGSDCILRFHKSRNGTLNHVKFMRLASEFNNQLKLRDEGQMVIELKGKGQKPEAVVAMAERFLVQYESVLESKGELQNVSK